MELSRRDRNIRYIVRSLLADGELSDSTYSLADKLNVSQSRIARYKKPRS